MKKPKGIPFIEDGRVEAQSTKVVAGSLDEAWLQEIESLPNLSDADRRTAACSRDFERAPGKYKVGFQISQTRRVIAVQGGWWYRGVTCAEVDSEGTRITYTMVNVASGVGKWIAHFFQAREARRRMGL